MSCSPLSNHTSTALSLVLPYGWPATVVFFESMDSSEAESTIETDISSLSESRLLDLEDENSHLDEEEEEDDGNQQLKPPLRYHGVSTVWCLSGSRRPVTAVCMGNGK